MSARGWVETDIDQSEKDYEEWGKGREIAKKPPDGKSTWWICPARAGATQGAVPFLTGTYVHFVHDPRNPDSLLAVGVCPTKTRNQPCTWCAFLSRLRKQQGGLTEADQEYVDNEAAKENILVNAIRLDGEEDTLKVEPLIIPVMAFKTLNQILRDRKDGRDFTHPTKGSPVIFEREGKLIKTRYSARLANPRPLPAEGVALLDSMIELEKVYPELDHEGLKAIAVIPGEAPAAVGADRQLPAGEK